MPFEVNDSRDYSGLCEAKFERERDRDECPTPIQSVTLSPSALSRPSQSSSRCASALKKVQSISPALLH